MLTRILQTSCGTRCKQTLCINSAQHYSSLASTDHAPKRLRRALQYVPGSFAPEKLSKAIRGPADGYVLDLEDSVSEDRKDLARSQVGSSVVYLATNSLFSSLYRNSDLPIAELLVRVNHTKRLEADLAEVVTTRSSLNTLLIPKVNSAEEIHHIAALVDKLASRDCAVEIIASIESARAVIDLKEIAQSSNRLTGLMFAAEDYCADVGVTRTPTRLELLFARSAVVTTAKAFGLSAIDMVCIAHKDLAILQEEAEDGARLGFTGKQVIHPAQVDIVQRAFAPSPQAIKRALKIIEEMRLAEQGGRGAYSLQEEDGSSTMIDAPMILQAKAIIQAARSAGLMEG